MPASAPVGVVDDLTPEYNPARNFLVPQGKAVPATKKNIEFFEA
ncbi:hypothetical protein ACUN9W_30330, partial [Escherichia coli]